MPNVDYNGNQYSGVLQLAKCCNCLHSLDTAGTAEWVARAIWRPTALVPSLCQSHIGNTAFFAGNLAPSLRLSLSPYALSLLSCFSLCSVVYGCRCSSLLFPLLLGPSSASSSVSSSSCSCYSSSISFSFSFLFSYSSLPLLALSPPSSLTPYPHLSLSSSPSVFPNVWASGPQHEMKVRTIWHSGEGLENEFGNFPLKMFKKV